MCNELDQQICQMAQRSAEGVVDALCAGVGYDLGGQTTRAAYPMSSRDDAPSRRSP